MKFIILGCGGSFGTPEIACECYTCTSSDPKNKRTRASLYIETDQAKVLIDAGSDLRQHALTHNLKQLDAVIITHAHSDHISGLNDLKPFTKNTPSLPVYLNEESWNSIKGTYSYLFEDNGSKIYRPALERNLIAHESKVMVKGLQIQTFPQVHGEITSLGIKVGNVAYSTDFSEIPANSEQYLYNLDCWIIDCMRYHWTPSHVHYERVLDLIQKYKPKRAILTHMAHEIEYNHFVAMLPPDIEPAYDGMVISCPEHG